MVPYASCIEAETTSCSQNMIKWQLISDCESSDKNTLAEVAEAPIVLLSSTQLGSPAAQRPIGVDNAHSAIRGLQRQNQHCYI